jgi:hypothetical protein
VRHRFRHQPGLANAPFACHQKLLADSRPGLIKAIPQRRKVRVTADQNRADDRFVEWIRHGGNLGSEGGSGNVRELR